jgi:hypothetical protein
MERARTGNGKHIAGTVRGNNRRQKTKTLDDFLQQHGQPPTRFDPVAIAVA